MHQRSNQESSIPGALIAVNGEQTGRAACLNVDASIPDSDDANSPCVGTFDDRFDATFNVRPARWSVRKASKMLGLWLGSVSWTCSQSGVSLRSGKCRQSLGKLRRRPL
jgi:hypothetical protein